MENDDSTLLKAYVRDRDGDAFRQLVDRHINFVYAAAFRQSGDGTAAQDITQAVFLLLSQRAGSLKAPGALKGWLFNATRYVASTARRSEQRRARREREAAAMHSEITMEKQAAAMSEYVDDALASLPEKDRQAVLLRYFEDQPLATVGAALGISEQAAQKRVTRAIGRLRDFLTRRGAAVTEETLPGVLAVCAAQSAPAFLAKITVQMVLSGAQGAATSGSAVSLAKGAAHMMIRNQMRILALKAVVATVCVSAATAAVVKEEARPAASAVAPAPVLLAQAQPPAQPDAAATEMEDPEYEQCRGVLQGIMDAYEKDDLQKLESFYYADPATSKQFLADIDKASENDLAAYRMKKVAIGHFGTAGTGLYTRDEPISTIALDVLARIGPEDMTVQGDWVIITPPESLPGLWPHAPLYFKQDGEAWKLDIGQSCRLTYRVARQKPVAGETPEQTFVACENEMTARYNAVSDGIEQGKITSLLDAQKQVDQIFADMSGEYSVMGVNVGPK